MCCLFPSRINAFDSHFCMELFSRNSLYWGNGRRRKEMTFGKREGSNRSFCVWHLERWWTVWTVCIYEVGGGRRKWQYVMRDADWTKTAFVWLSTGTDWKQKELDYKWILFIVSSSTETLILKYYAAKFSFGDFMPRVLQFWKIYTRDFEEIVNVHYTQHKSNSDISGYISFWKLPEKPYLHYFLPQWSQT